MNTFAERLTYAIEQSGLKKKEIDAKLNLNKNALTNYKKGIIPDTDKLLALSSLLNVSMDWLLTGKEPERKTVSYDFTRDERIMLELYRQLSPINKGKIVERMETMLDVVREKEVIYKAVPLVGASAAGTPIQALDLNEHQLLQTTKLKADFALTIKGQSMEPMIRDNSVIFVHQTPQLENGEIGVFQINNTSFSTDEEVTCKIYKYITPEHIQLLSVNPEYPVIDINPTKQSFKILGKVIL